jgi:hypothetical protein
LLTRVRLTRGLLTQNPLTQDLSLRVSVAELRLLTKSQFFVTYYATNQENDRWSAFCCTL